MTQSNSSLGLAIVFLLCAIWILSSCNSCKSGQKRVEYIIQENTNLLKNFEIVSDELKHEIINLDDYLIEKTMVLSDKLPKYKYTSWYFESEEQFLAMSDQEKHHFFKYKESQYSRRAQIISSICDVHTNTSILSNSYICKGKS